ncbi:methylmalonic aciduria and homocystinuria type C protein homolog [Xyrichtys novacula]|uniref:Cyanocobalamin reductase / alkylcobalamin dealkylase n=1 Tax=Xyrichtys novacula TaxID=13765 RepID=A0AAV1FGL9_XYRNO|nr:methylmalonic aciduria and homocystinuria type C protein homolog [Xyrichtys novacula]
MAASTARVEDVTGPLDKCLSGLGFEVHPLKVGWYNAILPPSLALSYADDTLAVVVFSTPSVFEKAFLPFLEGRGYEGVRDPIDQCVRECVSSAVSKCFPGQKVDISYDYELLPSRRPRFLAQTAAHVSGGAYYYQQKDITEPPWTDRKMFGVCVHPQFGGWFAIRALLVFVDLRGDSDMQQSPPADCVPTREDRVRLLEAFNLHWQDWSYRNIIPPIETYSQRQRDYFSCPPSERLRLLKSWGFLSDSEEADVTAVTQREVNGHG